MKGYLAVVLIGTGVILPSIAFAAEQAGTDQAAKPPAQAQAAGDDCDRLIATLDQRKSEQLPITMDQARAYKSKGNIDACRQGMTQLQAAAGEPSGDQSNGGAQAKVLVQQPAAQIKVEQAPPQVTVSQGQPQIMIHQPAPTVTLDIPPAEIVVRMPAPQVAVQQEKPQVDVQQAKPDVAVNDTGSANAQAKVQLEQTGQPAVQYQSDEPKVVINKAKEPPKIRFEQMAASGGAPAGQPDKQASTATDQAGKPADQASGQAGRQQLQVAQLKQMPIVNDHGDNLGTVAAVVVKSGTREGFVILRTGQFLGIGEKSVAVPFANVLVRGNQLVINGLSKDQIGSLAEWKNGDTTFQQVPDNQNAEMNTTG